MDFFFLLHTCCENKNLEFLHCNFENILGRFSCTLDFNRNTMDGFGSWKLKKVTLENKTYKFGNLVTWKGSPLFLYIPQLQVS